MLQGKDIYLDKAEFEDWPLLWRSVWSRPETARYMLWRVVPTAEEAQDRMRRTVAWQRDHDAWLVYEKTSGAPIGFAGVLEAEPGVWEDTGIALGPDYTGRGWGKQVVQCLLAWCGQKKGAHKFRYTTWRQNTASHALARACGFVYTHSEPRTDPRTGEEYIMDAYEKTL